jgi:CheY-like chemotaxis protein
LATVYGIVEQSGAHIRCISELGRGTTFKIYFPRAEDAAPAPETTEPTAEVGLSKMPCGSELVLLVEDEDTVRRLARSFLENRGYRVLEARHGAEALALCKNRLKPIDLLLTDIVMPEMGGRELAEHTAALYPNMKVLFMSGYTDDALVREGIKVLGTPFLQKPFTLQELARTVREVLDAKVSES